MNTHISYLMYLESILGWPKDWRRNPISRVMELARIGDIPGIQAIDSLYKVIGPSEWQMVAEIGASHGYQGVVEYAFTQYDLNGMRIGIIARDAGYPKIASASDGYAWVTNDTYSKEYDPFPLQFGPSGDPMEDKGKDIIDWRMQDWDESMLPEEVIPIDDEYTIVEYQDNEDDDL